MAKKSFSIFLLTLSCCALVNFVSAKTVPPSAIEPIPDMYSIASTYPGPNNMVNYNASPNPQYSSNNYNNFNEPTPPPPLQMLGNYQNMDYQQKPVQQQKSMEELGNNPATKAYDYSNELKNTLVNMKDNLGFMADTQRLLLNSFKVQQQQYNDIEEKLKVNEPSSPSERNAAYGVIQPSYAPPTAPQQPQYQSAIPSLLPLPYGQQTNQEQTVHHHKKHSHQKGLGKLFKKQRRGNSRGLALMRRRSESDRLERHAAMTLAYIKNGIVNALWTAVVVACVKLAPILLFGFKLMFKSVLPLTGLALFGATRGLFPQQQSKHDHDDHGEIRLDDDDDEVEEDEDDELDDEEKEISAEKDEHNHHHYG